MASSLTEVVTLLINTVGSLFILAVLLRFLLQLVKADFYNPVSQALVKATSFILKPMRRIIPGYKGIDFASLVLAILLNILATCVMILASGYSLPDFILIIGWACIGILSFIYNIYFYGLIISIISSWIAPFSGNPILLLVHQLLEPLQSRVRKIIPPMGGLDFSPIAIFLGLNIFNIMVIQLFASELNLRSSLVIGI